MGHRLFFPQSVLDQWVVEERAEIEGAQLHIRQDGHRYLLREAVHVIAEVEGGDKLELVGKVRSLAQLAQLSAEVLERSMLIGDAAYDVVPGFVGDPMEEGTHANEEELLARYLLEKL